MTFLLASCCFKPRLFLLLLVLVAVSVGESFAFVLPTTTTKIMKQQQQQKQKQHPRVPVSLSVFTNPSFANVFVNSENKNKNKDEDKGGDSSSSNTTAGLGAWVPVASASALQGLDPTAIEIMGRQFVVWQNPLKKEWSVMADACPHRLAPLSQGRVDSSTGCIECPYHGWQFDSTNNGTLTKLPQWDHNIDDDDNDDDDDQNQKTILPNLSATSYPVHLTGDLIWTFLPTVMHGESFPMDLMPEDYYIDLAELTSGGDNFFVRDLPYSWDFFVENVMDGPSHFPFAHNRLGSIREDAAPIPMEIEISNATHYIYKSSYIRNNQSRDRRQGLQRPFLCHQDTECGPKGEWKKTLLFFAVPVREGRMRFLTNLKHLAQAQDPKASISKIHRINQQFFDSDIWMHDAELAARSKLKDIPDYVYPSSCDLSVKGYRQWWVKHGYSQAPPHTFGPASPENLQRLSRREQIDPWVSHTQHCSICRGVLRKAKLVEKLSLAIAAVGAVVSARRSPLVACACLVAGFLARRQAKKYVVALEGEPYPSGVGDRSVAAAD